MINLYYKIKWFIQRGKRGYSDADISDFTKYLSNVIGNGLIQLSEQTKTYPPEFDISTEIWSNLSTWKLTLKTIGEGFKNKEGNYLSKFSKYFNSFWGII